MYLNLLSSRRLKHYYHWNHRYCFGFHNELRWFCIRIVSLRLFWQRSIFFHQTNHNNTKANHAAILCIYHNSKTTVNTISLYVLSMIMAYYIVMFWSRWVKNVHPQWLFIMFRLFDTSKLMARWLDKHQYKGIMFTISPASGTTVVIAALFHNLQILQLVA